MSYYIVELENNLFLATCKGDPGRTLVEYNAKRFKTIRQAKRFLTIAREYRHFKNAKIKEAIE